MRRNLIDMLNWKSLLIVSAILMLNICFSTISTFGTESEAVTKVTKEKGNG